MKIIIILAILTFSLNSKEYPKYLQSLQGPPHGEVLNFLVDKDNVIYVSSPNGFFKSTNNGDSWEYIFDKGYTKYMNLDSDNNLVITMGPFYNISGYFFDTGYYTTSDKGKSWSYVKDDSLGILIIDTLREDIYYKLFNKRGSGLNNNCFFIYKSLDKGKNWQVINNIIGTNRLLERFFQILDDTTMLLIYQDIDISNKTYFYLAISSDYGITWSKPNKFPGLWNYQFYEKNKLIIASDEGVYTSNNFCETLEFVGIKLKTYFIKYNINGSFYAATNNGLFYSKDTNFLWNKISDIFLEKLEILSNGRLLGYGSGFIYVSDDSGKTWRKSMKGFTAAYTNHVSVSPHGDIYCMNGYNVFKTTDKGTNWDILDLHNIIGINFSPQGDIYAAEDDGGANLYKSTDRGATWEKINKDFIFPGIMSQIVFTANGNIVCNSNGGLVTISKDGGNTWEQKKSFEATFGLTLNSEGHLFGGGHSSGIVRSTNDGEKWDIMRSEQDLYSEEYTKGILFHPTKQYGYAYGLDFLGKTTDNGRSWIFKTPDYSQFYKAGTVDSSGNIIMIGFEKLYIHYNNVDTIREIEHGYRRSYTDMETAPDGTIYVSVAEGGLYRLRLDLIDGVSFEEVRPSPLFAFPNPAGDYIEIEQPSEGWQPSEGSAIRIYNSIGECVMTSIHPMTASHRMNVESLPPGIYFLRCGEQTSKFVKM